MEFNLIVYKMTSSKAFYNSLPKVNEPLPVFLIQTGEHRTSLHPFKQIPISIYINQGPSRGTSLHYMALCIGPLNANPLLQDPPLNQKFTQLVSAARMFSTFLS